MKLSSRKNRCRTHIHHAPPKFRKWLIKYMMSHRMELKLEGRVPKYSLLPSGRSAFHFRVRKGNYVASIVGDKMATALYNAVGRKGFLSKYLAKDE